MFKKNTRSLKVVVRTQRLVPVRQRRNGQIVGIEKPTGSYESTSLTSACKYKEVELRVHVLQLFSNCIYSIVFSVSESAVVFVFRVIPALFVAAVSTKTQLHDRITKSDPLVLSLQADSHRDLV